MPSKGASRLWIAVAAVLIVAGVVYALGARDGAGGPATGSPDTTNAGQAEVPGEDEGGATSPADLVAAYQELLEQVEAESPDHAAVLEGYRQRLQPLVRQRDAEGGTTLDEHIVAVLEAGARAELPADVVAEIFDKVLQAALHATIKHELREAREHWGDAAAVSEELAEAEVFYEALKGTVGKREQAYGVELQSRVEAAFGQMRAAVEAGSQLDFALGSQLLDKTLMKTFYLAVGAEPHGYAFKARASADEGELEAARKQQAEGWGFYQALRPYLEKHDPDSASAILAALDLQNPPGRIDPAAVNRRFVAAFLATARDEFAESQENWGTDEGVITSYEGALFVDLIGLDLSRILGQEAYEGLLADAQAVFEATRAGDQAAAKQRLEAVERAFAQVEAALGDR